MLCPPFRAEHINERAVCNAIAPEKDVDGFHIVNIGKLCLDQRSMVPATPAAVWEIIKRAGELMLFPVSDTEELNKHYIHIEPTLILPPSCHESFFVFSVEDHISAH